MRAMVCTEQGKPAKWEWREWQTRSLGPKDVRVAIRAAGVNFPDRLASEGGYHIPTPPPYIPGLEAAGDILEVGEEVTSFTVGQSVIIDGSSELQGLFADECVVDQSLLIPLPEGMSYEKGSAFPVVYATGYHALVQRGQLEEGETLVVHGAAGGVGLAALQIGRALGARVIATVGDAEKAETLRSLGYPDVITVDAEDVRARILELTDGQGADVFYDPVGGELFDVSMRSIAKEGRILIIGAAGGQYGTLKTNHALVKEVSVVGVLYGAWKARKPKIAERNMEALVQLASAGKIDPHIWKVLPMSQTPEAIEALGSRRVIGKVVVVPDGLNV
ncbi:NADPH:quinone oxidoreductase [Nitratireductor aestuarii]|uniref:NADPH:quinone oxidoreductase n=1 Tax=Nitratireductor aestuarii TaxID=1735103 RepID=A0A916W913_9HYPH|nr:NADPH:quinone oxidoreductase family protein [Nitratireductor aestuarii]GGA78910.1 NADPH:quinone oxidoreductase [Nitratireductor aestuarii]